MMLLLLLIPISCTMTVIPEDRVLYDMPRFQTIDLPEEYDSRTDSAHHTACHDVLFNVPRISGRCGDCYALAGALMVSQRYCLHTLGKSKHIFSARHLTQCTEPQQPRPPGEDGCNGGNGYQVLKYVEERELVNGSSSSESVGTGCQDYTYSLCDKKHPEPDCPPDGKNFPAGPCEEELCDNREKIKDEQRCKKAKAVVIPNYVKDHVDLTKKQIMSEGPVLTDCCAKAMAKAKKGEIIKKPIECDEDHMVVLVGWGKKGSKQYWKAVNVWGTTHGDSGVYYVEMGKNVIKIEEMIYYSSFASAPPPARLFQRMIIEDVEYHCWTLAREHRCPKGQAADAVTIKTVDFGCVRKHSLEARKMHRFPNRLFSPKDTYYGISKKVYLPLSCVDVEE